jgi:hypothetical protein
MAILIAFPLLSLLVMVQSAIVSHFTILNGCADIVLLSIIAWALQERVNTAWQWAIIGGILVNIPSALPFFVPLIGYLLATGIALLLRRRIWQRPFFAMLVATFFASLISLFVDWFALALRGHPLPLLQSINLIIIPSLILNLFLSIFVYTLIGGLAEYLYPEVLEV